MVAAAVWFASRWGWGGVYRTDWCLVVARGTATIECGNLSEFSVANAWWGSGWTPRDAATWDVWLPPESDGAAFDRVSSVNLGVANFTDFGPSRFRDVELVLWPVPLLLCTPAAFLLRSGIIARRRAIAGSCSACGYSLAGIGVDAPCPECGRKRAATA